MVKFNSIVSVSLLSSIIMVLGGWDTHLTVLIAFMIIDFILGVLCAILSKSNKTKNKNLNSSIMVIGIIKKVGMLICVIIGNYCDILFNVNICRNCVIISFILNELLSCIENLGIIGIPMPKVFNKIIDMLKERENND